MVYDEGMHPRVATRLDCSASGPCRPANYKHDWLSTTRPPLFTFSIHLLTVPGFCCNGAPCISTAGVTAGGDRWAGMWRGGGGSRLLLASP